MDDELIDYIITHYSELLSIREKAAQKHFLATKKAEKFTSQDFKNKIMYDLGSKDAEVLKLVSNGYEEFKRISAENILKEHKDNVFINNCPKCGRLARTPRARQCRHCGHDWH
jgi:carbamoylphosphate synthase small subunit